MLARIDLRGSSDVRRALARPAAAADDVSAVVADIVADVRARGDDALREYTKRFDRAEIDALAVPRFERAAALERLDPTLRAALELARDQIAAWHEVQAGDALVHTRSGVRVEEMVVPVDRAGCYVPGGRAPLASSVLMTALPARVAGVSEIALCTPPRPDGTVHDAILAAAELAQVDVVYRVGGAQAIAAPQDELNINLCALRDIDIEIAEVANTRFADVFWTMFKAGYEGQKLYGTTNEAYMISGKDGVHPGWAGHLVMAYTFLRAMGLNGDIGTLTVDLGNQTATGSAGHTIEGFTNDELTVVSTKYPFCVSGEKNRDSSLRSGATLVPFFQDLSRFRLVVTNAAAANYLIIWGTTTNIYSATQLADGVNLAADFVVNPFCDAFKQVDEAVAAKQAYETKQIKKIFHGPEGKTDMAKAVERTEAERALLAEAIAKAMVPVRHTIRLQPMP